MTRWIVCLLFLVTFSIAIRAQDDAKTKAADAGKKTVASLVCPVTGEDADEKVSYEHEGKTYYFCCAGCVAKFKKEPAKYIKSSSEGTYEPCQHGGEKAEGHDHQNMEGAAPSPKPADEGTAVINSDKDLSASIVNSTCIVTGEDIDPKAPTVSYKGKVYGVCCKGCAKKFAADPEKYLNK